MTKAKKKDGSRFQPLILLLIVLITTGLTIFAFHTLFRGESPEDNNTTDINTKKEDNKIIDNTEEKPNNQELITNNINDEANEKGIEIHGQNSSSDIEAKYTSIVKTDNYLQVYSSINAIVTGSCTLEITTPSGKTISYTSGIIDSPASSFCDTFSVPLSSLESGTHTLVLTVNTSDSRTATIISEETI